MVRENLHIGMIMDGNRRWAKQRGTSKLKGHKYGAEKLKQVLRWCKEASIRELTLYTLSTENLNRTQEELESLFDLFRSYFKQLPKSREIKENKIKINFTGNFSYLPQDLRKLMRKAIKDTENQDSFTVNFCVGYGGRQEILDAVNDVIKNRDRTEERKEITQEEFENNLYLNDNPDLIIRTGGRKRISNFLLWQSAYSEWFFTDTLWPALTKKEFFNILEDFENRKRNFGK